MQLFEEMDSSSFWEVSRVGLKNGKANRFQILKSLSLQPKRMQPWFAYNNATQHWSRIYCVTDRSLSLLRDSRVIRLRDVLDSTAKWVDCDSQYQRRTSIYQKILKIEIFIKECVEISSRVLSTDEDPAQVAKVMENIEDLVLKANILQLNDDSRQVSDTVRGYVIHKTKNL